MTTVTRILVPYAFTDGSERALDFARMLSDKCGASLHLLHVIGFRLATPDRLAEEQQAACRRLEAIVAGEDRTRRPVVTACRVGTIASEIVRYAADEGVDLIVMGTHRHGPSPQMETGSIAEAVIEATPCAVLTVKGAANAVPAGARQRQPA
jgi:nucleotide-binding universal stress UspA family protein